ncbi:MAG: type II toxin-antitoxin system VapC family toxin [Oligoflexia bacterium]|nr:type II toxin-antitoxin system VapC family toxin [Oligoflexia bacterium]
MLKNKARSSSNSTTSSSLSISPLLLDTCAWVWLVDGNERIKRTKILDQIEKAAYDHRLFLAPISMWEIATKISKKKLTISLPILEWIKQGKYRSRIIDAPFNEEIACDSAELEDFHGDPADRIIVSTARHLNAFLITGDSKIISYAKKGHVSVLKI